MAELATCSTGSHADKGLHAVALPVGLIPVHSLHQREHHGCVCSSLLAAAAGRRMLREQDEVPGAEALPDSACRQSQPAVSDVPWDCVCRLCRPSQGILTPRAWPRGIQGAEVSYPCWRDGPVSSGELERMQLALALDALQLQRAALLVVAGAPPALLMRLQ